MGAVNPIDQVRRDPQLIAEIPFLGHLFYIARSGFWNVPTLLSCTGGSGQAEYGDFGRMAVEFAKSVTFPVYARAANDLLDANNRLHGVCRIHMTESGGGIITGFNKSGGTSFSVTEI